MRILATCIGILATLVLLAPVHSSSIIRTRALVVGGSIPTGAQFHFTPLTLI
jgi:hypothetical protein